MLQHNEEERLTRTSAADLAVFAQTLQGEPLSLPAHAGIVLALTESERLQREQEQRERDQARLGRLLRQLKRTARQRKYCLRLFAATCSSALIMGVLMLTDTGAIDLFLSPFLVLAAFALVSAAVGTLLHVQAATLVAHLPDTDVRAIGPLLESLNYADMEGVPQRLLVELLPQVTPGDAVLFHDAHRQALYRALDDPNTDMVVLLLEALEKIGDGRAMPAVRRLADGGGRAKIDSQVLYAAQHCLPLLEARAVHDTANHTLLRASAFTPHSSAQLLRSVTARPDDAPSELLRADNSGH